MKKKAIAFLLTTCMLALSACTGEKATKTDTEPLKEYREKKQQAEDIPFSEELPEEYGTVLDVFADEEERFWFLSEGDAHDYHVVLYDKKENSYGEIALSYGEQRGFMDIEVSPEGEILLFDTKRAYLFLPEGGAYYADIPAWPSGGVVFPKDGTVICQVYSEGPYLIFDLKTGEGNGTYLDSSFLSQGGAHYRFFLTQNETGFFLYTGAGIYENLEGKWILKVSSEGKTLSKSSMCPVKIEKQADETFVVWEEKGTKYEYKLEDALPDSEKITLQVAACEENPFLKNALIDFQIQNPEIEISYTALCQELPESQQEMNTLIQQMNAAIVSDKAADVYVLDSLPWEEYQEKDCLADLTEWIQPVSRQGKGYEKVLTGFKTEDGLCAVPLYFTAQFAVCEREAAPYAKSIYELADYLREHPEKQGIMPVPYKENPETFLAMVYRFYQQDLYEDGQITYETVKRFMEATDIIYRRLMQNPYGEVQQITYQNAKSGMGIDNLYHFVVEQQEEVMLYPCDVLGLEGMTGLLRKEELTILPVGGYQPKMLLGIHQKSENKEAAGALLQYLLEYYEKDGKIDSNTSYCILLPGIPINQQFIYDRLTETMPERYPDGYTSQTSLGELSSPIPEKEDMDKIVSLLDSFAVCGKEADARTDHIYGILQEKGVLFLQGEQTLSLVTDQIYQGIDLIQKEKR